MERILHLAAADVINERLDSSDEDVHFPQALVSTPYIRSGRLLMRLDKVWDVWARASRMLADLAAHIESSDEHAFPDRLPYVLDLLAGVRRQIDEHKPRPTGFTSWWDQQRTPHREAITSMRNAELKSYERHSQRSALTHTNSSAGSLDTWSSDGKLIRRTSINAGDTVTVFTGWRFVGGHFDGQEVLSVLFEELADLSTLIHDAESRLDTNR